MNEIIEELWKHYMCNPLVEGGYTKKDGFEQAIQTACKAQRNACWREYIDMIVFSKPGDSEYFIKNAEITKEDYE